MIHQACLKALIGEHRTDLALGGLVAVMSKWCQQHAQRAACVALPQPLRRIHADHAARRQLDAEVDREVVRLRLRHLQNIGLRQIGG